MHYSERTNNLDLVRLLLALVVVLSHMDAILPTNYWPLQTLIQVFSGTNAVDCFFVISGFLIFQSCRRSRSLLAYSSKRIRRIYPGLVVVILICAVGVAPL